MSIALSRRRVVKNALSQLLTFALAGGSKALAAVMVARSLGPDGMGAFSLSWTLAGTLAFMVVLGLDNRLIRALARTNSPHELEVSMPLAGILGLTVGGMLVLFPHVTGAGGSETAAAVAAAGGFLTVSAPIIVLRAAFHARERMELETATTVLEGAVALIAVAAALAMDGGVVGAMTGLTLGRLANLVLSLHLYTRLWGPLRLVVAPRRWSGLIREGWALAVSYSLTAVYLRFDLIVLAIAMGSVDTGHYGGASVILLTIPLIAVSLSGSLYPVLARSSGTDDPELARVFSDTARLLLVASMPLAAGLTVMAGEISSLLYGEGFGVTGHVLAVLAWVVPFRFVNHLFGVTLASTDLEGRRTPRVALALLFNAVACAVLIPLFGIPGAVAATLLTEVAISLVLLWAIRPLKPRLVRPLIEGGVLSACVAAAAWVGGEHVLPGLVAGGVVYLGGMLVFVRRTGVRALSPKGRTRTGAARETGAAPVR